MKSTKQILIELHKEYEILNIKIINLKWFIDVAMEHTILNKEEQILMVEQYIYMNDYASSLKNRAKLIENRTSNEESWGDPLKIGVTN